MGISCISSLWLNASRHLTGNASEYPSVVAARDDEVLPDPQFRSTIRSTKSAALHDFGGFRRSPRVCKSLKNLKAVDCHGRGRGFEPRRPRHKAKGISSVYGSSNLKYSTRPSGFDDRHAHRSEANLHQPNSELSLSAR